MRREPCRSYLTAIALSAIMTDHLFGGYRSEGEPMRRGGENLLSVQVFKKKEFLPDFIFLFAPKTKKFDVENFFQSIENRKEKTRIQDKTYQEPHPADHSCCRYYHV